MPDSLTPVYLRVSPNIPDNPFELAIWDRESPRIPGYCRLNVDPNWTFDHGLRRRLELARRLAGVIAFIVGTVLSIAIGVAARESVTRGAPVLAGLWIAGWFAVIGCGLWLARPRRADR
jgi:hypothetical protein